MGVFRTDETRYGPCKKKPDGGWVSAAYRAGVQAGISPLEFWELTPYLTRLAIEALTDARYTQAWIQANLIRAKAMPKLEELLDRKFAKTDMELRMKDALMRMGSRGIGNAGKRN